MPLDTPAAQLPEIIGEKFSRVRRNSNSLAAPLTPEDCMIQSMAEASPVKWNLGHTSWFFETFILGPYWEGYRPFHESFGFLFNSYYNQIGERHPRAARGMLSRPSLDEVMQYRAHVDEAVETLLAKADEQTLLNIAPLFDLGCAHEEQHQELLLTDLQHGLFQNALMPAVFKADEAHSVETPISWRGFSGGVTEIGWKGDGFAFDNEGPRHKVFLEPFELASRPVTNAEFLQFIEDGGYGDPLHWLSDGWDAVQREGWAAPLYWRKADDGWRHYTLFGERLIDPHAPVAHVSFFEANAYASWAGARLPTEIEWEHAATGRSLAGRFLENGTPLLPASATGDGELLQLFGDVWEWTASPYTAYPGYAPAAGAVGEYNGKFMSGQMVLKGGSVATPSGHIRSSYRNFFHPASRWQFSGVRLARDCR